MKTETDYGALFMLHQHTSKPWKSNVEIQKIDCYMSLDNSGYMGWIGDLSFECVE